MIRALEKLLFKSSNELELIGGTAETGGNEANEETGNEPAPTRPQPVLFGGRRAGSSGGNAGKVAFSGLELALSNTLQ